MRNILEFILLCIIFLPATTIMLWIDDYPQVCHKTITLRSFSTIIQVC